MLGQAFAHCPIFPTAASRRSLDRLSVPMWPFNLSVRLPIVDLVGRYLTNYLIGRELTPYRIAPFTSRACTPVVLCGISTCFQVLSPCMGQIAHALLTRPPLESFPSGRSLPLMIPVRLACVKHAASVRPEPGSNSDVQSFSVPQARFPPASPKTGSRSPTERRFTHSFTDCLPLPLAALADPRFRASLPSSQLLFEALFSVSFSRFAKRLPFVQRMCYYIKGDMVCQALFLINFLLSVP